jgi:hypothetical protein
LVLLLVFGIPFGFHSNFMQVPGGDSNLHKVE